MIYVHFSCFLHRLWTTALRIAEHSLPVAKDNKCCELLLQFIVSSSNINPYNLAFSQPKWWPLLARMPSVCWVSSVVSLPGGLQTTLLSSFSEHARLSYWWCWTALPPYFMSHIYIMRNVLCVCFVLQFENALIACITVSEESQLGKWTASYPLDGKVSL